MSSMRVKLSSESSAFVVSSKVSGPLACATHQRAVSILVWWSSLFFGGCVISNSAQSLYALRVLRHHGMNDVGLQTVFRAVVVMRLIYASPAWRGFATATDLKRVDTFLRRCKRCGYCSSNLPDFEELLDESDHQLFCKTLNNSNHTLHKLLRPQSTASQHYHLRRRTYDRQLPTQLVICVIKTLLHEHCIKTVIKFVLVCTVYPELSCVLLRYVSFTNKEWLNVCVYIKALLELQSEPHLYSIYISDL